VLLEAEIDVLHAFGLHVFELEDVVLRVVLALLLPESDILVEVQEEHFLAALDFAHLVHQRAVQVVRTPHYQSLAPGVGQLLMHGFVEPFHLLLALGPLGHVERGYCLALGLQQALDVLVVVADFEVVV